MYMSQPLVKDPVSPLGLERFAKLSFDCAETKKLSNLRVNDGFLRETIETIGGSGHKCY